MSLPDRQTSPRTNTILLSMLNYLHTRYTVITAVMLRTVYLSNAVTWFMYFFFFFFLWVLSVFGEILYLSYDHNYIFFLGIRPVWSESSAQSDQSSLSARRKLGPLATHWAHSENSDQTWRMPRLIWVFASAQADLSSLGAHAILLVWSCGGSCVDLVVEVHARQTSFSFVFLYLFIFFFFYLFIYFFFFLKTIIFLTFKMTFKELPRFLTLKMTFKALPVLLSLSYCKTSWF